MYCSNFSSFSPRSYKLNSEFYTEIYNSNFQKYLPPRGVIFQFLVQTWYRAQLSYEESQLLKRNQKTKVAQRPQLFCFSTDSRNGKPKAMNTLLSVIHLLLGIVISGVAHTPDSGDSQHIISLAQAKEKRKSSQTMRESQIFPLHIPSPTRSLSKCVSKLPRIPIPRPVFWRRYCIWKLFPISPSKLEMPNWTVSSW